MLALKRETTIAAYALILRQFLTWLASQPGHETYFDPGSDLTQTAVCIYVFGELAEKSVSHAGDLRDKAMFALGSCGGGCPSDVYGFRLDQVEQHISKTGWIIVGSKCGQVRTLRLVNEARQALRSSLAEERQLSFSPNERTAGDHL